MSHVDPFAPADSDQHPMNFGRAQQEVATATAESAEEVEYRELFEAFGYAFEPGQDAADQPVTLDELRELAQEFSALWDLFAYEDERDGRSDDTPNLFDLRAREKDATGAEVQTVTPPEEVTPTEVVEPPKRPSKSAPAATWHAYAKQLDPNLTDEDLKSYTVAGIQAFTAAQDGTAAAEGTVTP